MIKQRRPDFIGIGAMKAATTWAWHQLQIHPDVTMPWPKEHHYFDQLTLTPQQYLASFRGIEAKRTGEVTPAYLTIPHAPWLARSLCPKAKIFAILRNPTDRAFSHWKVALWTELKIPKDTSFRESFDCGHPHLGAKWHSIKEKGLYFKYLRGWYSCFPNSVKVFWYEDLIENPKSFLKSLYEWVGVDPDFDSPDIDKKFNVNWSRRNPVFKEEDRKHVVDYYRPSIEKLEDFTGRDLSGWKQ